MTDAVDVARLDLYGQPCDVTSLRKFKDGRELGAGQDVALSWYVYDKNPKEPWHKHCGPYSTYDQAARWILDIREER